MVIEPCGPGASEQCLLLEGEKLGSSPAGDYGAALQFPTTGPPRNASISADIRLSQLSGTGVTDVLAITGGDPAIDGSFWFLEVEVGANGSTKLTEYLFGTTNESASGNAETGLRLQEWEHVELAVSVSGGASSAELRVNGAVVVKTSLRAHLFPRFFSLDVGDRQLDVDVTAKVRFDNVVVRITP
jgi:hypothetical protein